MCTVTATFQLSSTKHAYVALIAFAIFYGVLPQPVRATSANIHDRVAAVYALQNVRAERAARALHGIFPAAAIRVDAAANALIVLADQDSQSSIRSILAGIDIRNPALPLTEALPLREFDVRAAAKQLGRLFPHDRFQVGPNRTLFISASPQDAAQIHSVLSVLDSAQATPSPRRLGPTVVVRVTQRDPRVIARAIARDNRDVHVAVSGNELLIGGPPDDVSQAKLMASDLDQPEAGVEFTRVYRVHTVQATSLGDLLQRAFPSAHIHADPSLNALAVLASSVVQQRVADAVTQLDVESSTQTGSQQTSPGFGSGLPETEVVRLRAAVPAMGGGSSTSPNDIAQSVTQSLAQVAPDLRIIVHANSTKLILTGTPRSIQLAKQLIGQLDVAEPLVELDTEVLEVDEGVQKQLGFKFPTPVLSTTYTEVQTGDASGTSNRLLGLQPLTRTPLTLGAELDFLVSTNRAKILEDPRITTFSGRTASLHAGETVNILTTTGGGSGTVATTQVQSFQTGVTLDITPVVNADDYVTVTLHPSINSEAGISSAGVPNIQTRDTTTTIGLHAGETIVVGGLIEDDDSRTITKVPILGDLPLIGRFFQDVGVSHTRNELIVTVTPHIVGASPLPRRTEAEILAPPSPAPLPTIDPVSTIPPVRSAELREDRVRSAPLEMPATAEPIAPTAAPPTLPSPTPPAPLPSAFADTNVYTFGQAPPNNYADPSQPPQIFFIQVQPTVVKNGQPVTLSAITTTNVTALSFGPSATAAQVTLISVGPGKWQSTFNFSSSGLRSSNGNVIEMLTATTALGGAARQTIPFSIISQ